MSSKVVIEQAIDVHIIVRGDITLSGAVPRVALAGACSTSWSRSCRTGQGVTAGASNGTGDVAQPETTERPADVLSLNILSQPRAERSAPRRPAERYIDAIDAHTSSFGIGPAGTGKTYLAMAKAVRALQAKQVNRIILTRPAVEAGEALGFLPGTLSEKIDPYLRPLYDALHDMIDPE